MVRTDMAAEYVKIGLRTFLAMVVGEVVVGADDVEQEPGNKADMEPGRQHMIPTPGTNEQPQDSGLMTPAKVARNDVAAQAIDEH